jgi:hypothetical protein
MACEECILAIENNGTDSTLDRIGIELDAAAVKESPSQWFRP